MRYSFMKGFGVTIILICCTIYNSTPAEASWLIDVERFHVSAHGRMSCQDCHADISANKAHPDPADVNRSLKDFFRPEQCTECHEDARDEIAEGSHGDEVVTDPDNFRLCIACHAPHYQVSYSDSAAEGDLSRPAEVKCSVCHDFKKDLPPPAAPDEPCLDCHRSISPEDPRAVEKISNFCFHCHGAADRERSSHQPVLYPLIEISQYTASTHAGISCLSCHGQAAEFIHAEQTAGDCRRCHRPHDAKIAHDVHLNVACGACHLRGGTRYKDAESGRIQWQKDRKSGELGEIHHMVTSGNEESCRRCHYSGNRLGAVAMVLPAKGIICMPCHVAAFSAADTDDYGRPSHFSAGYCLSWIRLVFRKPGRGKRTGHRKHAYKRH